MGKPPHFDGTDYAHWSDDMQVRLYEPNPHLWTIVCVGVPQLGEDEVVTPEHEHDLFRNAQAVRVIKSSLCTIEYNKVRGMISAKEIWKTLQMSHEGNDEVKEGKMDLLQGELEAFVMKKDETLQQMHDRLTLLFLLPRLELLVAKIGMISRSLRRCLEHMHPKNQCWQPSLEVKNHIER